MSTLPQDNRSTAQRFMELFRGLEGVHGTHGEPVREGVKWGIKTTAKTLREPVTEVLWEQHLAGRRPLGVVPITAQGLCWWGSIDVDKYDINLLEIIERVEQQKMPQVPCRSKSGGLHLFRFYTPAPTARAGQDELRSMAASLGLAGSEIFPKQTELLTDRGDAGNWIIMPYFGGTFDGKLKTQVGLKKTGAEMTAEEFLDAAERLRCPVVTEPPPSRTGSTGPFGDGPRCLEVIARDGFPEGGRNSALFMIGLYLKRKHSVDWKEKIIQYNEVHMRPPLTNDEVQVAIRSLEKKEYEYTCKIEPMCSHCDAAVCRTRRYGVGDGESYPTIEGLSRVDYEEPEYNVTTPFGRVRVTMHQLHRFDYFNEQCGLQAGRLFIAVPKHAEWLQIVDAALREVVVIEPPPDLKRGAAFHELLTEFLVNRARGSRREDILAGRPWEDEVNGQLWFRLADLVKFLGQEGMKMTREKVGAELRRIGGEGTAMRLQGNDKPPTWCWYVPTAAVGTVVVLEAPPSREQVI